MTATDNLSPHQFTGLRARAAHQELANRGFDHIQADNAMYNAYANGLHTMPDDTRVTHDSSGYSIR